MENLWRERDLEEDEFKETNRDRETRGRDCLKRYREDLREGEIESKVDDTPILTPPGEMAPLSPKIGVLLTVI